MRWVYWWHTVVPDPSDVDEETVCVKLNTDFETAHLNGHDLAALVSAWQAGAISRDTLLHNLRQGEILPPGRSSEQEMELVRSERAQTGRNEQARGRTPVMKCPVIGVRSGATPVPTATFCRA
jgi:hypothetical protein